MLTGDRTVEGVEGQTRILAQPADSGPSEYIVVVGASTGDREEALAGLAGAFLVGAPIALLLASGLGYLLAGRALAPVEAMRRRAAEITLERSGERLPLPKADDEIHDLGATLNTMLDRIEASLDRERVFVADASHELRTPLAILRTELGAGRAPAAIARGAAGGDRLGGRGGGPALAARRGPAGDRALGPGPAADQARAGRAGGAARARQRPLRAAGLGGRARDHGGGARGGRRGARPAPDRAGARKPGGQRPAPRQRADQPRRLRQRRPGRALGRRRG